MTGSDMSIDARRLIAARQCSVIGMPEGTAAGRSSGSAASGMHAASGTSFSDLFSSKCNELSFSAHAASRIKSRNIDVSPEAMAKLQRAVDGAAGKGAKESLILMNNNAFIVNIPNRMVVTAMDGAGLKENIFTNIDSAVVVD